MPTAFSKKLKLSLLLLLPATAAVAQHQKPELPYNTNLVKQQPKSGAGNPTFRPSPEVRGMRALSDRTVYLVSTDNQSLSAYQGSRLVWKTNVVSACPTIVGQRQIRKVTLRLKTIFVAVGNRIFTEVNTGTGKVIVAEVQKN